MARNRSMSHTAIALDLELGIAYQSMHRPWYKGQLSTLLIRQERKSQSSVTRAEIVDQQWNSFGPKPYNPESHA